MENIQLNDSSMETAAFKKTNFLPVISGLFVGILILSNILAAKMVQLGPLVFDGGTLLFPFSYIFGDVLGEVYGYKASRKVIWTGFFMLAIAALNIWIISILPAEGEWTFQKDFDNILLQIPRITLGSLLGYFIGEYSNSVVISKMKVITSGKHLWLRTISSTLVGEFLDSIVFVLIAFAGIYTLNVLVVMAFSNYFFKTAIEIIFTPFTYKIINFVKKNEQLDVYDYGINYNPFPIKD